VSGVISKHKAKQMFEINELMVRACCNEIPKICSKNLSEVIFP
jgi:hypothetical protein